ncbi:hypothetical protein B0H19DRAFT_1252889 [Mycena capillaripes]|nr:hypothetical protein B0H19DRAFT_1252889 [Mycena capillaripes]
MDLARLTSSYTGAVQNYTDTSKQINGKADPSCGIIYCNSLQVTFTTAPPTGMAPFDEMFAAHAEYSGLYTATPIPNLDMLALGMKFSIIEEFLEVEVKPWFGQ